MEHSWSAYPTKIFLSGYGELESTTLRASIWQILHLPSYVLSCQKRFREAYNCTFRLCTVERSGLASNKDETMSESEARGAGAVLSFSEGVWVIELQAAETPKRHFENTFTPALISSINGCLDKIEASAYEGPAALVVTSTGKFFSNGHNIAWLEDAVSQKPNVAHQFIDDFYQLLARLMVSPS